MNHISTFHLVSLGCPKNRVDSEVVYGLLEQAGWRGCDEPEEARVLLINTCGFIEPAVQESVDEILRLAAHKVGDETKHLVVFGCMVQRYQAELVAELPEVDLFVGTEAIADMAELLAGMVEGETVNRLVLSRPFLMSAALPRVISNSSCSAYVKITEGCDNRCSYCLIPSIRGPLRSRPPEDIAAEVQHLQVRGIKEVVLIAQDLTAYGADLPDTPQLVDLLTMLLEKTAISWIRLLYLYPTGISEKLLRLMASQPRLVPYLDIPMQHIGTQVLARMNRRYTGAEMYRLIGRVRAILPDVALRTTFLLGFPGETDKDVEDLLKFLRWARFSHVGAFAYCNEPGSPSAAFADQIPDDIKTQRVETVMQTQAAISSTILGDFVGTKQEVLVEGVSAQTDLLLEGRTRYQAPDIDGCVFINEGRANRGDLVRVLITESHTYDLVGKITG
jgi:ribosomal protein S12 methylthiotransferase